LKTIGKKIATVSDIHLHHDRVPAKVIIESLMRAFPDNWETAELDAIIIAGDLFDKIMRIGSDNPDYAIIHAWMVMFLEMCARLKIAVRILEGTPSHDRGQSKMMEIINDDLELAGVVKADLKYFDTVTVDWDETLGLHILYVPDEVHPDPEKVWEYVSQSKTGSLRTRRYSPERTSSNIVRE
jgi:predicted MPP superfamily phosphohydrolase